MSETQNKNKIISTIKTVVFFIVVGVLSLYILTEAFMPNQTVKLFGFKPYIVITRSMEPVLNIDDVVIVKNPDTDALEVGDIITFHADINYDGQDDVVTHYIHMINENDGDRTFRTRRHFENPENIVQDTWILGEDDILGSYVFKIPRIGVVIRYLQSPFGVAAILVNIGVIAGIVYLIKHDKKKGLSDESNNEPASDSKDEKA